MGKTDVQKAYRIVPIHPGNRYLMGMKWRDRYFGISPYRLVSAQRQVFLTHYSLADLSEWIVKYNYHAPDLLHYLDMTFSRSAPQESCLCTLP
jgi:hypothetical protein